MKNMIKSVLAVAATILFANVGLAEAGETFSFIMGAVSNFNTTASSVLSVKMNGESFVNWDQYVTCDFKTAGKVTFTAVTDTPNKAGSSKPEPLEFTLDNNAVYNVTVKTVEIEKTIMPWNAATDGKGRPEYAEDNKSNSTIRVVTHILGVNVTEEPPNVLFIGSRCRAHQLEADTIIKSLNALATVGNVDWYLFDTPDSQTTDDTFDLNDSIAKGHTCDRSISQIGMKKNSNHSMMKGVYNLLEKIADGAKKYHYIVFETDGSRMAHDFTASLVNAAQERKVAEYLKPFYDDQKIIWVLDNGTDYDFAYNPGDNPTSAGQTGTKNENHGYFDYVKASAGFATEIYQYGGDTKYRVNNSFMRNYDFDHPYVNILDLDTANGKAAWLALLGLFDPELYLEVKDDGVDPWVEKKDDQWVMNGTYSVPSPTTRTDNAKQVDLYAGHEYDIQAWYDDADTLNAYLLSIVKPLPISARIADQVVQSFTGDNGVSYADMGLKIVGSTDEEKKASIRFYHLLPTDVPEGETVDADSAFWGDPLGLDKYEVDLGTMTVTGKVDKTETECWNKIEIDVVDDGTFFQKCLDAGRYEIEYDSEGRKVYILNPNDGDATVELFDASGNRLLRKDGAVVPEKQWPFEPMAMNATCEDVIAIYNGEGTNVWHYAVTNAKTGEPVVSGYSVSNRYDGASTWYEQGKFPGYTNVVFDADGEITSNKVWFLVVGPEGYTNTAPQFAWVTITQRVVTVEATDASKIYTQPKADDPEFKWDLKAEGTDIVVGEEAGVYEALSNVVELVRVNSKNPSEDPEEDVVADDPFKYVGVITTNTPWATKVGEDELLWNYRVEFLPGDFTIFKNELAYVAPERDEHTPSQDEIDAGNATPYDYVGIYEGKDFTIRFGVTPVADLTKRPTRVRFATGETRPADDSDAWSAWTDYKDSTISYDSIPKFKDCVTKAPVYVQAKNEPNYPDITNLVAYVTITQRIVRIQANTSEKVYDGTPLVNNTFTLLTPSMTGCEGFVSGEGFASNVATMTDESTITDVGEQPNVMDEGAVLPWQEGTKPENYKIERDTGNLKVTKRPIVWGNEGDDPQEDESLVWVRNAVKVYDGIATGIVVGVKGIAEADLGKVNFAYSETDPSAPKLLKAAALPGKKTDATGPTYKDVLNDEETRTVWCTVSVTGSENYIPCTVSGTVLITRRPITLSSPSKKCLIDELPEGGLTFTDAEIADMTAGQANAGYVKGEVFAYSNRAALDKLGSLPATFDCGDNAPALLNNYTVTKNLGTLQVQKEQEILYPEGDGGQCICDRVTRTYIGTIFYTEPGKNGTIGTLELKTKPKKGGVMDIQAKVYSRIDDRKFTFRTNDVPNCADCGATCPIQVVLNSKGGKCGKCLPDGYRKLVLTIDGDSIMGFFVGCPEGDAYVDASRDAFSSKKTGRWQAILPYVGKWNGAFEVKDGETSLGLAQFNLTLNKSGKTSVKGWMPDGNKYSYSGKAHVGTNDFVAVPILLKKKVGGELRTVGIRVKFDTQLQVVECRNVSPWQTYFKKRDQYENIADLTDGVIGMPEMTKAQFKAESVIVDVPAGSALTPIPFQDKISYNAKTGVASGRLVWKIAGKSCTGKVTGVVIGDELVGVVKVNGYGTYAISFNRPEVQDN